jgi:hypothetical protein
VKGIIIFNCGVCCHAIQYHKMIKLAGFWNLGASPRLRGVGLSAIMNLPRRFTGGGEVHTASIPCATFLSMLASILEIPAF